MDVGDTPEEAAFRAEARAWLAAEAPPHAAEASELVHRGDDEAQARWVLACRRWQRTLRDGGWAGITWPTSAGGRGGTAMQQVVFNQEQSRFGVPVGALAVGVGMVGPTLLAWGRPDQQERYLAPMLAGDELWCQLFSEPGAGSDLPSLATRAERDGDHYVVNGQKVWTTLAQFAEWAILLARTDPAVAGRRGISYLLVDVRSPGIEVRPLRQLSGAAHFNEVFLTDVRVPADHLVGAEGEGWQVARTTMASERVLIGAGGGTTFADVTALARTTGKGSDPLVRQQVAEAYVHLELLRFLGLRVQTAVSNGHVPGAEASIVKLAFSNLSSRLGDLGVGLLGTAGTATTAPAAGTGDGEGHGGPGADGLAEAWQGRFLNQWAARIGGGTDQIQRNAIAERVLGLPRDPTGPADGTAR